MLLITSIDGTTSFLTQIGTHFNYILTGYTSQTYCTFPYFFSPHYFHLQSFVVLLAFVLIFFHFLLCLAHLLLEDVQDGPLLHVCRHFDHYLLHESPKSYNLETPSPYSRKCQLNWLSRSLAHCIAETPRPEWTQPANKMAAANLTLQLYHQLPNDVPFYKTILNR